jgi:type II secretory pathway component PulJ
MRARQRGITLLGLIIGAVVVVLVALLGMRLLPSYIEYFTIKKTLVSISNEMKGRGVPITEVRRAFQMRSAIDDIKSVSHTDLEITRQGNDYLIVAAYRREIPLFANLGIYIDFEASSQ